MSDWRERRAVARLRAAQAAYRAHRDTYGVWVDYGRQGSVIELERNRLYNDLNTAEWPFNSGRYAWPGEETE